MYFGSITALGIITLLTACGNSDHYPIPPEYAYDLPPESPEEQKPPPPSSILSIALSMGEKPTTEPQDPVIADAEKEPPVTIIHEKNITIPADKPLAITVGVEEKSPSIPELIKTAPAPEKAKPSTPIKTSMGLKELDFSSAAQSEKKITTVKLENEELTHSRKLKSSLYSTTERGRLHKVGAQGTLLNTGSDLWYCVKDNKNGVLWEAKTMGKQRHAQHTYSMDGAAGSCGLQQCSPQQYVEYLNKIELCGRNNWRLPKRTELVSLVQNQHDENEAAIDGHYLPNTQTAYYWSSTPFKYAKSRAWAVDFSSGFEKSQAKTQAFHLRLVSSDI